MKKIPRQALPDTSPRVAGDLNLCRMQGSAAALWQVHHESPKGCISPQMVPNALDLYVIMFCDAGHIGQVVRGEDMKSGALHPARATVARVTNCTVSFPLETWFA